MADNLLFEKFHNLCPNYVLNEELLDIVVDWDD